MKCSRRAIRGIVAACVLSLSLVRPLIAQQEVSPDHFNSAEVQDMQTSKAFPKARATKVATQRTANKRKTKVRHARRQTASLKKVSG